MLSLRLLNKEEVENIYHTHMVNDFPKAELKPLKGIMELIDENIYDCFGLFEADVLKAYGYFGGQGVSWRLLDYYAVCVPFRGKGYGSQFLRLLLREYQNCQGIFVEIESLNDTVEEAEQLKRRRRKKFYNRNGFSDSGLYCRLFGVGYDILYYAAGETTVSAAEAEKQLAKIYQLFLPQNIYQENVKFAQKGIE